MPSEKNTVLLVDDDEALLQGLARHLRHEPYEVLTCLSGPDALETMAHHAVDVVIADEFMPRMPGSELVSRIRKQYPAVVCMILSGKVDFQAAIRSINQGEIYRFLQKPCDPFEVAISIRLALERKKLLAQVRELTDQYQEKLKWIQDLGKKYPDIFDIQYDQDGCTVVTREGRP